MSIVRIEIRLATEIVIHNDDETTVEQGYSMIDALLLERSNRLIRTNLLCDWIKAFPKKIKKGFKNYFPNEEVGIIQHSNNQRSYSITHITIWEQD